MKLITIKTILISIFVLFAATAVAQSNNSKSEFGYVKFEFNTDSAMLVLDYDHSEIRKVAEGDSIALSAGRHTIELFTPFDHPFMSSIFVQEGSTKIVSHTFSTDLISYNSLKNNPAAREYFKANMIIVTDHDSKIYSSGNYLGTGFANVETNLESIQIKIENPDFGAKNFSTKSENTIYIVSHFRRPVEKISKVSSIFPGASQAYKKQYLKAAALGIGSAGLLTFAALRNAKYHNEMDVFHEFKTEYENANTEEKALQLGELTESQRDFVAKVNNQRKFLLISGILAYAYNIYDGLTSTPKGGYANKEKDLKFYLSQEQHSGTMSPTGTLRYNF